MRKILNLIVIILIGFVVAGCVDPTISEFKISIEEDTIYWNELTDALYYNIYIDNVLTDTTTFNSYDLELKEGTYKIKVNAKTSTSYSNFSNVIEYYSDGSKYQEEQFVLDAPVVSYENNLLSWNKVANAYKYDIYLNDAFYTTTTNLKYAVEAVNNDTYYVVAVRDTFRSEKSNIITIEIKEDVDVNTDSGVVNIFSLNDTHGAVASNSNVTGLDKVQTLIDNLESNTEYVKVANGDLFQGGYASNVTRGRIFIDVLNEMDIDCFVIGNHEFDWGIETISVYNDGDLTNGEADFPFLGANIVYKSSSTRPDWIDEYTIVENNGLTVGIIGVMEQGLESSINSEYVENYTFLDPVPIVERLSKELRNNKDCDVIVVATHGYDSSVNARYASLSKESYVDAILCAHTHQKINETVTRSDNYKIPVLQSNTKNITVGTINLTVEEGNITKTSTNHYYPSNYTSSTRILSVISNYQSIIDEGEKIVGYTSSNLSKSYLGNLAANGMVVLTNADFACLNTGGVRSTISSGNITMEDIYEVFPFDNKLIIVEMPGSTLKSFYTAADGYLYFSSNFNSSSIQTSKTYKVCVIDYVYNYYYYQKYFKNLKATTLDYYIRDAVVSSFEGK